MSAIPPYLVLRNDGAAAYSTRMAVRDDRVPTWVKRRARDVLALARRRGVDLEIARSDLGDPVAVDRFLAVYGRPPADGEWRRALRVAEALGHTLTPMQAMNRFECHRFLDSHRETAAQLTEPGWQPSEKQVGLARTLGAWVGKRLPRGGFRDHTAWEAFLDRHLTADVVNDAYDAAVEFDLRFDPDSVESVIGCLAYALKARASRDAGMEAKLVRAREMLARGADPYSVAESLGLDDDMTLSLLPAIEAQTGRIVGF